MARLNEKTDDDVKKNCSARNRTTDGVMSEIGG